jgi:transcriptional regulator with XRE-family HTH domain
MLKRKPEVGELATSAETFGKLIKDLRETARMSQDAVAQLVPCDRSQIARVELGTRVPQADLVMALDRIFDTGGLLQRLCSQINWYSKVEHPDWFKRRAQMDAEAAIVREYGERVIPGLLQGTEYAETLFAQVPSTGDDGKRTVARLSRALRYGGEDGPALLAVLDESCLRRVVGSRAVMHAQCKHLLEMGLRPNIRIQVAPFGAGQLILPNTPMSLITLPDGEQWVYSESLDRGHFSNDPAVFAQHSRTYDVLRADALSASDSAALIREAMEGYADDEEPRPQRSDLGQEQLQRQQRRQLHRGGRGPRLYGRTPRP